MTTINISVPDDMQAFIETRAASEGYASANEYVRSLIRDAQRRQAKLTLEARFREAVESGPAVEMTREDWDSIEGEALEGLSAESIRP